MAIDILVVTIDNLVVTSDNKVVTSNCLVVTSDYLVVTSDYLEMTSGCSVVTKDHLLLPWDYFVVTRYEIGLDRSLRGRDQGVLGGGVSYHYLVRRCSFLHLVYFVLALLLVDPCYIWRPTQDL